MRWNFFNSVWADIENTIRVICGDSAIFVTVLAVLGVAFAMLRVLALLGYAPDRIDLLDAVHYYAYLAVLALLMVNLLLDISFAVLTSFRGKMAELRKK